MFLTISQCSQENACVAVFLNRGLNTGAFLRILRNIYEHFFYRTPLVAVPEEKINLISIFTLICGALKAFIKPFEAPKRSVKIKI